MQITDITFQHFTYTSNTVRDSEGHGHPGPPHEARQTLMTIQTDTDVEGVYVGGVSQAVVEAHVKPHIVGQNPLYREKIWQSLKERQRLHLGVLSDRILAAIDLALWDFAGKYTNLPVHHLLGATRERLPAYASTMCGDDLEGGLDTPAAYAKFAEWCIERGYPAFKLHTWQPPYEGAPSVKRDLEACAAVREVYGPEADLMLDPFHYYTRLEALALARGLEELDYYWMEEPMDENSMSSYVWLCEQTSLPICGPETAEGKLQVRAEWIKAGACDLVRGGISDVGGITPLMKIAHLSEAYGMRMEVHGGGVGNLHVLCAMGIPGQYYERGLMHPFIDFDAVPPWLNAPVDPMDDKGFVEVSSQPGLGLELNRAYIEKHTV